jgi:hypothetical protein
MESKLLHFRSDESGIRALGGKKARWKKQNNRESSLHAKKSANPRAGFDPATYWLQGNQLSSPNLMPLDG